MTPPGPRVSVVLLDVDGAVLAFFSHFRLFCLGTPRVRSYLCTTSMGWDTSFRDFYGFYEGLEAICEGKLIFGSLCLDLGQEGEGISNYFGSNICDSS